MKPPRVDGRAVVTFIAASLRLSPIEHELLLFGVFALLSRLRK
jgi:hypothetical protein